MFYIQINYEEKSKVINLVPARPFSAGDSWYLETPPLRPVRELDRNRCRITDGAYRPS
ncbi:MAG: hypothetical protein AB9Q18_07720 [Candidatus Reddybacter sp.]